MLRTTKTEPVGNAQPLDAVVQGQDVGNVSVIEPKSGSADKDRPIVGVSAALEEFLDVALKTTAINALLQFERPNLNGSRISAGARPTSAQ
jgi:hypothetical protein